MPPYYPIYARRFRSVGRLLARVVFSQVKFFLEPAGGESVGAFPKIMLYANHPGFWDPLVLALLTGRIWPEHAVLSAIDNAGLKQHPYFHGLGFFGLAPSSAGGLRRLLQVAEAALQGPGRHCLALTPEGDFSKPGRRPLKLRRGLAVALSRHRGPELAVVPVAIRYQKSPNARTGVAILAGRPMVLPADSEPGAVQSLQELLSEGMESTLDRLDSLLADGSTGLDLLGSR